MSPYQTIELVIDQSLARLTLNRPDAANGITPQMAEELMQAIGECALNPRLRALLITGNGKLFCAGGDVKSFAAFGDNAPLQIRRLMVDLHAAISQLARLPIPVIIAVNGPAAGAGFGLACAGDIVFAGESAHFTMAYTAIGLSPDAGASYFLPRLIGLRRTQQLMLTNRRLSAHEAEQWGIVTEVVADDLLLQTALDCAMTLANGPTRAFHSVKRLLLQSVQHGLESQLENEAVLMTEMAGSDDGRTGITAFASRQKPVFTGR
ncbi:MAG TPA: enoyl-CoA hydratase-related protein [Pseudomonadales bacterium]